MMTTPLRKQFNLPGIITPETNQLFYHTQALYVKQHIEMLDKQLFCSELLRLIYEEKIPFIPLDVSYSDIITFTLDNTLLSSPPKNKPFNDVNHYLPNASLDNIINWITSLLIKNQVPYEQSSTSEKKFSSQLDIHMIDILCQDAYQDHYPLIKKMMMEKTLPNTTPSTPRPKI